MASGQKSGQIHRNPDNVWFMLAMNSFFTEVQSHFQSNGFEGLIPLPLDCVIPAQSDLALIRVVREDRPVVYQP